MDKFNELKSFLDGVTVQNVADFLDILYKEEDNDDFKLTVKRAIRKFKLSKYAEIGVLELIPKFLTIVNLSNRHYPVETQFVPNDSQTHIIQEINSGKKGIMGFAKHRQEGVSSILEAFCAIKAYFSETSILYVNANKQLEHCVRERIIDFIEQLDRQLGLLSAEKPLYKVKNCSAITLSNGSSIHFCTGHNAKDKTVGFRADYVIFDEAGFLKNYYDIIDVVAASVVPAGGKIIDVYTVGENLPPEKNCEKEKKSAFLLF